MGVRNATVSTRSTAATGVGNNAEVIIVTSPPINLPVDSAIVLIFWEVLVNLGAAQTVFTPIVRRGSTVAGTVVGGNSGTTTVASTNVQYAGMTQDTPGIVAEQQYLLSLVVNGAASAGTVQEATIIVLAL